MKLCQYLKFMRRAGRCTRAEWARLCGVSSMTIWRWETGRCIPHEHELAVALEAFGVSAQERLAAYALRESGQRQNEAAGNAATEMPAVHRGDLLRALRHRRGWTLAETARAVGTTRSSLTRWERDEVWPSAKKMHRVASALGAEGWELVALTAPVEPPSPDTLRIFPFLAPLRWLAPEVTKRI